MITYILQIYILLLIIIIILLLLSLLLLRIYVFHCNIQLLTIMLPIASLPTFGPLSQAEALKEEAAAGCGDLVGGLAIVSSSKKTLFFFFTLW